jgi:putative DNA primase/helicase
VTLQPAGRHADASLNGAVPAGLVPEERFPLTDVGNAAKLVADHGPDLRYCYPWARWLVWDGVRWRADDTGEAVRRAKATTQAKLARASLIDDSRERTRLGNHALKSQSDRGIRAMLFLAQSEPGIPVLPDELDADPWKLNVLNGTLDLRTGKLREHSRADLITKLAPIAYDAAAQAPCWLAFLEKIFAGDPTLIEYVARLLGYSITGTTREHVLVVNHGPGANGKSTLLATMQRLLGDYAHQAPPDLLIHRDRSSSGATPDLADLQGRRLVAAIETGEGRRLDEALVKQLTGGDTINARRLYSQPFTFRPTHTIWLSTNHKPEIRGTDHAVWRRIALIPFNVTIPDTEQVAQDELLAAFWAEAPGILRWAVDGCRSWRRNGLEPPDAVRQATAAYRDEMDALGRFLDDCCTVDAAARTPAGLLFNRYDYWAGANGEEPLTQKAFGTRLGQRGFEAGRSSGARYWKGIALTKSDA